MELVTGQIVASRAGRDANRFYVVVDAEGDRVKLANGAKWTRAAPKPKNRRHLNPTLTVLAGADIQTDRDIQRALETYESGPQQGG